MIEPDHRVVGHPPPGFGGQDQVAAAGDELPTLGLPHDSPGPRFPPTEVPVETGLTTLLGRVGSVCMVEQVDEQHPHREIETLARSPLSLGDETAARCEEEGRGE